MARKSTAKKIEVEAPEEDGKVINLVLPKPPHRIVTAIIEGDEHGILQNNMKEAERRKIEKKGSDQDPQNNSGIDYSKKVDEWLQTAHMTAAGEHGHPCESFLKSMGAVVDQVILSTGEPLDSMKALNRAVSIIPDGIGLDGKSLTFFTHKEETPPQVEPAKHWAALQGRTPVPVYRTHLKNWRMRVRIRYNPNVLRAKDVLALLTYAGTHVGIGAYRPENRGVYGRFNLVEATDEGV